MKATWFTDFESNQNNPTDLSGCINRWEGLARCVGRTSKALVNRCLRPAVSFNKKNVRATPFFMKPFCVDGSNLDLNLLVMRYVLYFHRPLVILKLLCARGRRSPHNGKLVNSIFGFFFFYVQLKWTRLVLRLHHVICTIYFSYVSLEPREQTAKKPVIGMPSLTPAQPSLRLISICSVPFRQAERKRPHPINYTVPESTCFNTTSLRSHDNDRLGHSQYDNTKLGHYILFCRPRRLCLPRCCHKAIELNFEKYNEEKK